MSESINTDIHLVNIIQRKISKKHETQEAGVPQITLKHRIKYLFIYKPVLLTPLSYIH